MRRWRCSDCRGSRLPKPGNSNRRFLAGSDPARHRLSQTRPVRSVNWMRGGRPGRSPACRSQSRTRRPLAEKRSPPSPSTSPVVDARPAYPSNAYLAHLATPDARGQLGAAECRAARAQAAAPITPPSYRRSHVTHSAILTTCDGRICRFSTCAVDSSRAGLLPRFTASLERRTGDAGTSRACRSLRQRPLRRVPAMSSRSRFASATLAVRICIESLGGSLHPRVPPLHPRVLAARGPRRDPPPGGRWPDTPLTPLTR